MKKNISLLILLMILSCPAFCEVLLIQDITLSFLTAENHYEYYDKIKWTNNLSNIKGAGILEIPFSLGLSAIVKMNKKSDFAKFYLGGGLQFDGYGAILDASFTPAVSFVLSQEHFPMELMILSKFGAGSCIIWPTFYMFAELNPCFLCFFGQNNSFFAGLGPVIRYTQTYNYEIFNRTDFGMTINFGYRWK